MSKYKVTGLRTEQVFCFVEANSEEEAMEKASNSFSYDEEEVSAWTNVHMFAIESSSRQ